MKTKDILLFVMTGVFAVVVALLTANLLFANSSQRQQTAEAVDVITAEFPLPSTKYFNGDSTNPTRKIEIGDTSNPNPFSPAQ